MTIKSRTMKNILLIVPTRERPHKVQEFYNCFIENSDITDLCFAIDADDNSKYPELNHPKVFFDKNININKQYGLGPPLNIVAKKYCNNYDYIGFAGDDNRIRTNQWDIKLIQRISDIRYVIASGSDLFRHDKLPTWVVIDSAIIKILGFMSPPTIQHLYIDNFWKDLGEKLNTFKYYDDIVIEHMHYSNNKSTKDKIYSEVNSMTKYLSDMIAYKQYKETKMQEDIKLLLNSI